MKDQLRKRLFIYFSGYNPFPCKEWEYHCILEEGAADLSILTNMDEDEALELLLLADKADVLWEEKFSQRELKELLQGMKEKNVKKISSCLHWQRKAFYKLLFNMGL